MRLIVQADGGSRGNPGPAGYGAVVLDADSNVVLTECAEFIGTATNNVAEYRGVLAGLRRAFEIDPEASVEVRLDSKLIVEQMSGRWQVKHPDMRELAKAVRDAFPPSQVTYVWVPREQNTQADGLVNEVLDQALAGGANHVRRDGAAVAAEASQRAEDVIGTAQQAQAEAVVRARAEKEPRNVMVGWEDIGTPTVTHLARHGATAYSLEKRFSGPGGFDPPLAELGIAQAQALAAEIARRHTAQRIITSPLLRAQQTAEIISSRTGLGIDVIDGLAECAFGEWDGLTLSEVREQWPEQLSEWLASTSVAPPGGESFEQLRARVMLAQRQIVERHAGEDVVVVAHVSPIKILVGMAIDAPLTSVYRMELPPCSLSSLAWFPDGNASMFSFAEAGHLTDVLGPHGT